MSIAVENRFKGDYSDLNPVSATRIRDYMKSEVYSKPFATAGQSRDLRTWIVRDICSVKSNSYQPERLKHSVLQWNDLKARSVIMFGQLMEHVVAESPDRIESPRTRFQFSPDLIQYISDTGFANDAVPRIDFALLSIEKFLRNIGVQDKIEAELFVDPEDIDWKEIKLSIKMKENPEVIHSKLKPRIRELARKLLPKEILEKTLIVCESMPENDT